MRELTVTAALCQLDNVLGFIENQLETCDCPPKAKMGLLLAAEEVFVNIAQYAYLPEGSLESYATIRFDVAGEPACITITFLDGGRPFNPLTASDPDLTCSAEERNIGGLGIFLTKKMVDVAEYRFDSGRNILILRKTLYPVPHA